MLRLTSKDYEKKMEIYQVSNAPVRTFSRYRPRNSGDGQKKVGLAASAVMAATMLGGKAKYILAGLKLTKMTPLISMALTSFTYSLFFGWPYAVGMVGLIFVHETGHAIALRHYGVPFSPMVFVPFMGAVINMKDHPRTAYQEGIIALAGPALGGLGCLGVATAGALTGSQLCFALADFGYMINLFNLLPIGSMDGGRVANAISPWFSAAGLAGGCALAYQGMVGNPIFYLILLSGGYSTATRVMGWDEGKGARYYNIGRGHQMQLAGGMGALIVALLYGMAQNDKKRKTPRQLEQEKKYGYFEESPWSDHQDAKYDDFFGESNGNGRGPF